MADGNTVDFVRIDGANADAIDGNGQDSGTVTNCEIANITNNGDGVGFEDSRGNWSISNNTISNTAGFGVRVASSGSDTLRAVCANNNITNGQGAVGLAAENTSSFSVSITDNTFTNSAGTGFALEAIGGDDATFCLDIERNTNDDTYFFSALSDGSAVFQIEQRDVLTDPEPAGAGNTGAVSFDMGPGFFMPSDVADGTCGF
jgi:hypothetical protein